MSQETYVLDGIEVIKTGRVAVREKKTRSGRVPTIAEKQVLVEVKPLDGVWAKWVEESSLYKVQ